MEQQLEMDALQNVQSDDYEQFIVVMIGKEQYGIDINLIDNIVRIPKITRIPKSQPYYLGVINLRGEVVPVMSLRRRFGLDEDEYTGKTRIIIVKMEDNSMVGVMVDEVREVINLTEDDIEAPNFQTHDESEIYLLGIGKVQKELVSLLNMENVINDKE